MFVDAMLSQGSERLENATDAPRLEAEVLLASAMGRRRSDLLAHPEWTPTPEQRAIYHRWLERRGEGTPLPYLTGQAAFYGLELVVTPDVLIPRPETETLVDLALALEPQVVVDVGTGSGAIALALAAHLPRAQIIATDLSAAALQVATTNIRRHGPKDRIHLVQADVVRPLALSADLVISNPPYVKTDELATLPTSVRRYEPMLALVGGTDGLGVVRQLLASAGRILRPGGTLLIEIGAGQGTAATTLAHSLLPGAEVTVHPDLGGRDRVLEVGF